MNSLYQWVSHSVLGALPAGGDTCAHKVLARRVVKRGDGEIEEKVCSIQCHVPYSCMVVIFGMEGTGHPQSKMKAYEGLEPERSFTAAAH